MPLIENLKIVGIFFCNQVTVGISIAQKSRSKVDLPDQGRAFYRLILKYNHYLVIQKF